MDFASALLSFLAGATARSLVWALPPLLVVEAWRTKSAEARHAVLLVLTAGMLALAVLPGLLPPIPVPVLRSAPAPPPLPVLPVPVGAVEHAPAPVAPLPPVSAPLLPRLLAAVYLAGLAFSLARLCFGMFLTRRLLAAARAIPSALSPRVYESSWISVPLTVGWLHPRVLLPIGWERWELVKLDAVLVHERNHIRRGDWAIALLAAVNRSLYWFHPLAWWLERRLATLAEQACDDAALLALGKRESYAQALLDMATAVRTNQGRLVWDAMAMAKGKEVRARIERILDESRQIPRALTRSGWLLLLAAGLPLVYFTAALRPVPAAAQEQPPAAMADLLKARPDLTAADAAQIEQYLAAHPDDVEARTRLILYYSSSRQREPRLGHIYWLIANHPESSQTADVSQGIRPGDNPSNNDADYQRAAALWRQQAATHSSVEAVLLHAAAFFAQRGGDPNEAERLFRDARAIHPSSAAAADGLARLYATAILGAAGDPGIPNDNPAFANRVRGEIETNSDGLLLQMTGSQLVAATADVTDHPLLLPARELGARLLAQGAKLTGPILAWRIPPPEPAALAPREPSPAAAPAQAQIVLRGPDLSPAPEPQSAAQALFPDLPLLSPRPTPVSTVDPTYPPLARQARVQGTVNLAVAIDTNGHVTSIRVLRGHPLLIQAAIDAVKQWVYPPVSEAGAFVERVNFVLPPLTQAGQPLPAGNLVSGKTKTFVFGAQVTVESIQMGGQVQGIGLVKQVDPVYPPLAAQAHIEGTVTLNFLIDQDGTVKNLSVVEGHPLLVQATLDAVKQWVFQTNDRNGQPAEASGTVTIRFTLQHRGN